MPKDFYTKIKYSFNNSAKNYNDNAVLQHEIGRRLIESLEFFKIQSKDDTDHTINILDLGMGTGYITQELLNYYNSLNNNYNHNFYGLDLAFNMLQVAQNTQIQNLSLINGDINILPFCDNSIDVIFSNYAFQWSENLANVLRECHRVLKNDGLLFFSIPGPDTLIELRSAMHEADPEYEHVNNFIDMHNIGDLLVNSRFSHPVVDNDYFTLTYSSVKNILKDLKAIGSNVLLSDNIRPNLFSKEKYNKLIKAYNKFITPDNKLPLTYEVIYAHAFKTAAPMRAKHPEISGINNEVRIDIDQIKSI